MLRLADCCVHVCFMFCTTMIGLCLVVSNVFSLPWLVAVFIFVSVFQDFGLLKLAWDFEGAF